MAVEAKAKLTPAEYLALDRAAEHKSEFVKGEVYAMSGASERHNVIVANATAAIHSQLRKRDCRVYASDMRVRCAIGGPYCYPDLTVVCGPSRFEDEQSDTLQNPNVIIEVLSKTTEAYDRGEKFAQYRKIESAAEYVLVSQDRVLVEHFVRQPNRTWVLRSSESLDEVIELLSVDCRLALADIYEKTGLEGEE